jgi:hypothetical protein
LGNLAAEGRIYPQVRHHYTFIFKDLEGYQGLTQGFSAKPDWFVQHFA